jgi:hypothetical protein
MAEGMIQSASRWTGRVFSLDLPVWPDTQYRQVVLCGILPKAIEKRAIRVEVGGQQASQRFETQGYAEYVVRLPEPIPPGIRRVQITLEETWSPAQSGQGSDPRRLGFFLDALGLR